MAKVWKCRLRVENFSWVLHNLELIFQNMLRLRVKNVYWGIKHCLCFVSQMSKHNFIQILWINRVSKIWIVCRKIHLAVKKGVRVSKTLVQYEFVGWGTKITIVTIIERMKKILIDCRKCRSSVENIDWITQMSAERS